MSINNGSGYGYGSGIKNINGDMVYQIDNIATIIKMVRNNIAKGFILNSDLTLKPCYVVKGHNLFAHGKTLEKATQSLQEKIFANIESDEAIAMFLREFELDKKYPAKKFYIWHNRLTGSCEMGRNQFVKEHGFDLDNDAFTVQEFIKITKNAFGGNIIKQLEQALAEREKDNG